ncbi:DUF2953 domain-containing protein [Bacillus cereus]|uniref:DUF2953 domain-containing protein n=1 Tax=Bacillus cereus TaxID=1396 RepID=UPI00062D05FA|nr:DUF2953 domain-containing protein [Bacillus cereus]
MIWMLWFAVIIGIVILLIVCILLSKISLKFTFLYTEVEKQCLLQLKIWRIKYTFDILKRTKKLQQNIGQKIEKAEEEGGIENKILAQLDSIGELITKMREVHTMSKDFLKKVEINQWRWHSQIGTGDAASTGIVTGFAWSTKGMVVGVIEQYMHIIDIPELEITPVFQGKGFASRCELTASFHIYWIVRTALILLIFRKKQHSAGKASYKNPYV